MSTRDQRIEEGRRWAEKWGDPVRRSAMRPVALDQLMRDDENNRLIFEGLMHHYIRCACVGKLDLWAKAAHSAIELMAHERDVFLKRSDLQFVHEGER